MEPPLHAALGREVAAAASRVYRHGCCHVTPLLRSRALEARACIAAPGALFLKLESEQATGSFKARGAANRLLALTADERARGVVTASTGNHAAAVAHALAALPELRGVPAQIFLPRTVAPAKLARLVAADAPLVLVDATDCVASEAAAAAHAAATGAVYVSPYADPLVIGGQGTAGLEMLAQLAEMDVPTGESIDVPSSIALAATDAGAVAHADDSLAAPLRVVAGGQSATADAAPVVPLVVIVPVGGGGLIAGVAAALKAAAANCGAAGARRRGTVVVVGAQPAANACMHASVAAGRILPEGAYPDGPTWSDGTAGGIAAGSVTFDACAGAELGDDGLRCAVDGAWAACRGADGTGAGAAGGGARAVRPPTELPVAVSDAGTTAGGDGALPPPLRLQPRLVDALILVSEAAIERAMVAVLVAHGKIIEGAAGTAVAVALRYGATIFAGCTVVAV